VEQVSKPFYVQALVAQFAVEGFDLAVLSGLSRFDEVSFDWVSIRPLISSDTSELAGIVPLDELRRAALGPNCSNTRTTRCPFKEVSASIAKASRLQPSIIVKARNARSQA